MMCSIVPIHQWSLAVFLLCSSVTLDGKPVDALSSRARRSVSHVQLMHDKGSSLQELKRRMWLHELLEEVHTAGERAPSVQSRAQSQTFSGNALPEKPPGATKNLHDRFGTDRDGSHLPQETNKALAYKDQPLKVATKRKKKARLGRRRESDNKKRSRARSVSTKEP
ncbi:parathyroid hormone-related protein-like [Notolabrus celidotus]|uniref:parathyroid hormone-related protein-like n=1 Tax=Notolabrus celidotus TaxID=1203425 RepID=UPI00148FD644|nr:parathyroid hormone-related protein-like [Notolabrus celidotus]XP_034542491.1 parathyroid hormone-related protein-like [Notolabrus celidotus]